VIKVLLVVALLGAVVYALVWTIERRRTVGRSGPRRRTRPKMVAPDDDEDFLRSLHPEREPDEDDGPEKGPEGPKPRS
jgi:hypothetical protein